MQKSTKDLADKEVNNKKVSDKSSIKSTKKTTAKKVASITASKKTSSKTSTKKATTSTTKRATTKKSTAKSASTATKKTTVKKANSKAVKKTTTKKTTTNKKTAKSVKKVDVIEYYDLPYRYNQTIVKILAQTPNTLFVYWDISDEDRNNYIKQFGENFFNDTIPVLVVHNKTMNYSFEIEINDFANSWYFNINDAKCDYEVELGRRAKQKTINLPNNYMYIASSNNIETPNNHILFEKNQKVVFFRNIKTNETISKNISNFNFMKYAGKAQNIYDTYKKIYKHEELQDLEQLSSSKF